MSDFWSDTSSTSMLHVCEGPGETARMRRLAWAFAGCLCDKYHNLKSWLKLNQQHFCFQAGPNAEALNLLNSLIGAIKWIPACLYMKKGFIEIAHDRFGMFNHFLPTIVMIWFSSCQFPYLNEIWFNGSYGISSMRSHSEDKTGNVSSDNYIVYFLFCKYVFAIVLKFTDTERER